MSARKYLLSLPERFVRSTFGLGAGVVREIGQVAIPKNVRDGHLYQNLVETTLRFLIEQVGGTEGVYGGEQKIAEDFLVRRTAGNALEALGIVAFRASPVWVLAALADLCGLGRHLIPEISDALKAQGLLDREDEFTSVDEMLDGLERTSARLAQTINTPPLDVSTLRAEWRAIREEARSIQPTELPSTERIRALWDELKTESARQNRSVFETSSMLAIAAAQSVPSGIRWLSSSARAGASRTGQVVAAALLDDYSQKLSEIRQAGFATYAGAQLRPYAQAAMQQFSPKRQTITERVLDRLDARRRSRAAGDAVDSERNEEGGR